MDGTPPGTTEPASPAAVQPAVAPMTVEQERQWLMFLHLSALSGLVFALGSLLGPLIMWMIKKDQSAEVDRQGKEAVNFWITVAIVVVALVVIGFPLMLIFIGFLFWAAAGIVGVIGLVFAVIAAIKANNGEEFHYPLAITFLK